MEMTPNIKLLVSINWFWVINQTIFLIENPWYHILQREQREKHCVSTVQCYMKQHALTMDEACEEIKELTEDSWKFMIGQGLALKEYPIVVPRTVLEFARTGDYMYKKADKYTVSHTIKDMLTSLYVKPVLMWSFLLLSSLIKIIPAWSFAPRTQK